MNGKDEQGPIWIVRGPLIAADLPDGCQASRLEPDQLRKLSELMRGLEKLAQFFDN